jgi:hypothetical protein
MANRGGVQVAQSPSTPSKGRKRGNGDGNGARTPKPKRPTRKLGEGECAPKEKKEKKETKKRRAKISPAESSASSSVTSPDGKRLRGGAETPTAGTESEHEDATNGSDSEESAPGASTSVIHNCGHSGEEAADGQQPCPDYACLRVPLRCYLCKSEMPVNKIVSHIRTKHKNATSEQLELATQTMGLNAFQCGFPYLKLANIKGHLERGDCRSPDVCGQAPGSEPAGARLPATLCADEECVCHTNDGFGNEEEPRQVFCPVPDCSRHSSKPFGNPNAILQHVLTSHRDVPLSGLPWKKTGLDQCAGCGLLHTAGKDVLHSCNGGAAGTGWAASACPLQVLDGVTFAEIFTHYAPPPFWVYEHRRTINAFRATLMVVWTKVAENPGVEGWWKLMFLFPQLLLRAPKAPSDSAVAAIIQRCKAFRENTPSAWARLLTDMRSTGTIQFVSPEESGDDFAAVAARVHQLEARGEESKAFQTLIEAVKRFSVSDDDDVAAIQATYPNQVDGPEPPEGDVGGAPPPEFDEEEWTKRTHEAIGHLHRGRAAGSDGARAELFKALISRTGDDQSTDFSTPTTTRALSRITQLLAAGSAPKGIYPHLAAGCIVPIAKPNGGVRPIVLQPAFYKLTATIIVKEVAGALSDAVGPHQYGVGTPGGAQILAHKVRRLAEEDGITVLKLDMTNGFGRVNRMHLFKELDQAGAALKPLADFAKNVYGQTLKHSGTYNAGATAGETFTIDMAQGVVQGDPIAPVLFALSIKAALECASVAGHQSGGKGAVYAYLDDVYIVGTPAYSKAAFGAIKKALESTGGQLNPSKMVVYPDSEQAAEVAAAVGAGEPVEDTVVLGMHLGPLATVRKALADRIRNDLGHAAKRLVQLAEHDPQVTLRLTTRCFAHKATHILRVQSPEEVRDFTDAFDKLLRQVTDAVVMRGAPIGLSNRQWQQATLPVRLSGLGVTTIKGTASQAWLAAVAHAWPSMEKDPAFAGKTQLTDKGHYMAMAKAATSRARELSGTNITFVEALKKGKSGGLQKHLSEAVAKARAKQLKQSYAQDVCHLGRIESAASTSACLPFMALPSRDLSIPAEEFAVMAQQRLGVTTLSHPSARIQTKCICGYVMNNGTSDKHLAGCARLGNHVNPHNLLRDTMAELAGRAHLSAVREPSLSTFKGARGKASRADLRVVIEGQLRYYDATVVSMYRKDVTKNRTALSLGIADKLQKYKAVNSQNGHMKVMPLVMDAVGGTNRDLEKLADRIGHWLQGYLPYGALNWAIATGPMYVRAVVVTKVLRARARSLLALRAAALPIGQ